MKEDPTINYAIALKHYNQNVRGRSMRKFCEEEGYDYEKFMQYSRMGQKEYSVLKDADMGQSDGTGKFVHLMVDGGASELLGIRDIRVRFTNGMELFQNEGDNGILCGVKKKYNFVAKYCDIVNILINLPQQKRADVWKKN